MKRETIENGGVVFTFKAHAVCAYCTEFADFQADAEATNLEEFGRTAQRHFREAGWRVFEKGGAPTACPTCVGRYHEVRAKDLKVGDVILAKTPGRARFTITRIVPGLGAGPYLILKTEDGRTVEHETAFDSRSATYTVDTDPE